MVLVYVDLPDDLDEKIRIEKAVKNYSGKAVTIINVLQEYFRKRE